LRAGNIPIDQLVTHRTTLRDSPRDIALVARQKSGLIKAVIDGRDEADLLGHDHDIAWLVPRISPLLELSAGLVETHGLSSGHCSGREA